jgi:hypothetical protein
MNPWHLIWIVPLAASFGAFVMAIFSGGDCDPDWYDDSTRFRDTV